MRLATAGAVTLGGSLLSNAAPKPTIDVNAWITELQKKNLRGLGEAIPHLTEGATKALIVLEQGHFAATHSESILRRLEQCQLELFQLISDLKRELKHEMQWLLGEGVIAGQEQHERVEVSQQLRYNMSLMQETLVTSGFLQLPAEPTPYAQKIRSTRFLTQKLTKDYTYQKEGKELITSVTTSTLAELGALPILDQSGVVALRGAEDKTIYTTALGINAEKEPRRYELWARKKREDNVLHIAHQCAEQLIFIVFGALHDWLDNIQEWNKAHEEKFSLLVLRTHEIVKIHQWLKTLNQESRAKVERLLLC